MEIEKIVLNETRNVTLTAYLLEVGGEFVNIEKRPAMIVLPGGGYESCSAREADPVALTYLKAGFQVFVLNYSVKEYGDWPNPLEDYEAAMAMIRDKAEMWHVYADKIAVIGFSAGGHLAAAAATMSQNRPNAAILGYPLTGTDVKQYCSNAPDTVVAVDERTCPCFIFASRTDNVVSVSNSVQMMDALVKAGVAFESHIYAYGPHGFSTCDSSVRVPSLSFCRRIPNWVEDSIGWLKELFGDFAEQGLSEPLFSPLI